MPGHHEFRTSVLLRSEQTESRLGVVENVVPGGWEGPPLHHHAFDEAFYVVAGELTFQLGDTRRTAGRASSCSRPAAACIRWPTSAGRPRATSSCARRAASSATSTGWRRGHAGTDPPPSAGGPVPETIVVGPPIGG